MNDTYPRERILPPMRVEKAASAPVSVETAPENSSPGSFDELFLKYWTSIYRLLFRLTGDSAEAEDLAMETFVRLYQRPPHTGEGSNLRGWLFKVATNLGLHSIRSYRRRQHYELAAGKLILEDSSEDRPAELLDSKEANRIARLALGQLKPRSAQLLSLRYSGLSYQEVAEVLGLSPASIGPLLLRAEREFARTYRSLSKEEP